MSFRIRPPFIFQNLIILIYFFFHINFNIFNSRNISYFSTGIMLNLNINLEPAGKYVVCSFLSYRYFSIYSHVCVCSLVASSNFIH